MVGARSHGASKYNSHADVMFMVIGTWMGY